MANAVKWSAQVAIATALSTDLNSLASGSSVLSAAIDNSSDRHMFMDLEMYVTYGVAPSATGRCVIYIASSVDGSNYADMVSGSEPNNLVVATIPLRPVTSAQRLVTRRVLMPPGLFKLALKNIAGQTMAASANTLKYIQYDEEIQ